MNEARLFSIESWLEEEEGMWEVEFTFIRENLKKLVIAIEEGFYKY
jgi:hypothetical protein